MSKGNGLTRAQVIHVLDERRAPDIKRLAVRFCTTEGLIRHVRAKCRWMRMPLKEGRL